MSGDARKHTPYITLLCSFRHCLEALHADFDPLGCTIDNLLYGTKVRKNDPVVHVVSMRYSSSGLRVFSTDFTCFCHNFLNKKRYTTIRPAVVYGAGDKMICIPMYTDHARKL